MRKKESAEPSRSPMKVEENHLECENLIHTFLLSQRTNHSRVPLEINRLRSCYPSVYRKMRERSYSYSPSPSRGYGRRRRSPSPRGKYSRSRDQLPTSLLVRNLRRDCRPEDLRRAFGRYGPVKDVYLPRDYYTKEPRGFGFVQFMDPDDAADAKYEMDGYVLLGRELTVVFAEENRKKPSEMRTRDRVRSRSYERSRRHSPSPEYARSCSHTPDYYSPRRRSYSSCRSISPRGRSFSRSPYGSRSRGSSRDSYDRRSYSRSPTP